MSDIFNEEITTKEVNSLADSATIMLTRTISNLAKEEQLFVDMATIAKKSFDALVKVGFTEEHALFLAASSSKLGSK